MYYYYYYYGEYTRKVTFEIRTQNIESIKLEEFNELLSAFRTLHKGIVFLTQPEYQNQNLCKNLDEITLLDYHQLTIDKMSMESPLFLKISFHILNFSHNPYWALWKILISICKKYGSDSDSLNKSVSKLKKRIDEIMVKVKEQIRDKALDKLLGVAESQTNFDELRNQFNVTNEFLSNKSLKAAYNFFCETSITIDSLISFLEPLEFFEEEIQNLIPSNTL